MPISAYDIRGYAQFNPLSIQEMWAPSQQLREQHDKLAEEMAQQEQAGGLSLLGLKEGIDDEAIKIHKTYMDETKRAADELATKGFIESGRRKNLYGLKQQYVQNVVPLQNQLKIRQERADMLYKMKLQNPTYRATLDPNSIALTTGLKDPNAFNFDGVAGSDLYNSAAKKLEQLSKTITQDIPELRKIPRLSFQYFTAIQNGATPEQAANAMKRDGYDPATVDKMTRMIHGTIDSTMQEFGVYDKFKNDPKTIEELWSTTSQAAYNAIGQKQFGNMTDQAGMHLWQKSLETPKNPRTTIIPKFPMNYAPDISDKDAYDKLDNLGKYAKGEKIDRVASVDKYGQLRTSTGGVNRDVWYVDPKLSPSNINKRGDEAKVEILNLAKKNGIKFNTSSTGKMSKSQYNELVDKVISAEKEKLKSVSPVYTIATGDDNISKSVYQAIQSGSVTLPKSGSTELDINKFNELKKAYGNPVITYAPMGSGVEIRFGDGNAYKADGSIFQNPTMENRLKYLSEAGKSIRGAIMDPEKNKSMFKKDLSGNYVIDARNYGVDLNQYGKPNNISFTPSQLNSSEVKEYLKLISQIQNATALSEMFPTFATQNSGMDINSWTENKKSSNTNLYNNQE